MSLTPLRRRSPLLLLLLLDARAASALVHWLEPLTNASFPLAWRDGAVIQHFRIPKTAGQDRCTVLPRCLLLHDELLQRPSLALRLHACCARHIIQVGGAESAAWGVHQ